MNQPLPSSRDGAAAAPETMSAVSADIALEDVTPESALSGASMSGISYKQCMLEINGGGVVPRLARFRIRARPLQTSERTDTCHGLAS
jgi:hypothetical protein